MTRFFIKIAISLLLAGCSLAPEYQRPEIATPQQYKELNVQWLEANPDKATISPGKWWEIYQDPVLNELEEKIAIGNQDLKLAVARYDEAQALLMVARSAYFPMIIGNGQVYREQTSNTIANSDTVLLFNNWLLDATLSYEIDLWGQIRNSVAVAENQMQASTINIAAVNLSLQSQLASTYFALRGTDELQRVLDNAVVVYERAYRLRASRLKVGIDAADIYYQAKTLWQNALTLAADNRLQRAQLEHAIAVLIGVTPSELTIKPERSTSPLVVIEPALPSTLLERRPDIAVAEHLVIAANAEIGVTRSAFFPSFNILTGLGTESQNVTEFFNSPSFVWGIAGNVAQPIFEGGQLIGLNDQAWAQYKESVAIYRQTILTAYQEVEDALVALNQLQQENTSQQAAFTAADLAFIKANYRYEGGITTYLDVVDLQNEALQMELSLIDVTTRYQLATIQLIKALGGGWKAANAT